MMRESGWCLADGAFSEQNAMADDVRSDPRGVAEGGAGSLQQPQAAGPAAPQSRPLQGEGK